MTLDDTDTSPFTCNPKSIAFALLRIHTRASTGDSHGGSAAPRLLPDYSDVEIYCWPQAGATDPNALARLREPKYGARIFLCDGLHMKLYWVEGVGSVITSANLSMIV